MEGCGLSIDGYGDSDSPVVGVGNTGADNSVAGEGRKRRAVRLSSIHCANTARSGKDTLPDNHRPSYSLSRYLHHSRAVVKLWERTHPNPLPEGEGILWRRVVK